MTWTGTDTPDAIQLDGVRVTAKDLREVEQGAIAVLIPLDQLRRATLRHTFLSAHPFLQFAFGLVLSAIGLVPLLFLAHWAFSGERGMTLKILYLFVPAALGVPMVLTAHRRGYVLDVEGDTGYRRLLFGRRTDVREIRAFLRAARDRFGLAWEDDAPR